MSDMITDVAAAQSGALGLGPHQMFHNNHDEVDLMELGDKNAEGYDNGYVYGATHYQNDAVADDDSVGGNEELASSPLDILIAKEEDPAFKAAEAEYQAWAAAEAVRKAALLAVWQHDMAELKYLDSRRGHPRTAKQARLETSSVAPNVQSMHVRKKGVHFSAEKHKVDFRAMY